MIASVSIKTFLPSYVYQLRSIVGCPTFDQEPSQPTSQPKTKPKKLLDHGAASPAGNQPTKANQPKPTDAEVACRGNDFDQTKAGRRHAAARHAHSAPS
jgi:hypothetical protein